MKGSRLLLVTVLLLGACGSGHDRLQAELSALRSEVANLRARGRDRAETMELLENRVFILEGGIGGSGDAEAEAERALPVVSLEPDEGEPEIDEGPIEGDLPEVHTLSNVQHERRQRRPRLRLAGWPAPRPAPSVAPSKLLSGRHDSLGVAPLAGSGTAPGAVAASSPTGPTSPYDEGVAHARARRFGEAIEALRRFLSSNPGHARAPAARFLLGDCHARQGRHLQAIGEFERLTRHHPRHRSADVLLRMGLSYAALGDHERARQFFSRVVERHPGTAAARRATERVARLDATRRGG